MLFEMCKSLYEIHQNLIHLLLYVSHASFIVFYHIHCLSFVCSITLEYQFLAISITLELTALCDCECETNKVSIVITITMVTIAMLLL